MRNTFYTEKKKAWKRQKRENKIIKDVKNLFNLKKEIDDKRIKSIRNFFRLKKENEPIKDRRITDIRYLFDQEKEDYYKPVRAGNFWRKSYIENMKAMETEIKHFYLNNILIKLEHT